MKRATKTIKQILSALICLVILASALVSCAEPSRSENDSTTVLTDQNDQSHEFTDSATTKEDKAEEPTENNQKEEYTMNVIVSGKAFSATLADTEAAAAFAGILPLTLDMSELNGNEKYAYLDKSLPAKAEKTGRIETGDIMLYGNNCIVVFYKSFDTPYSYTRIGKITDTAGLEDALGKGSATVKFDTGTASALKSLE